MKKLKFIFPTLLATLFLVSCNGDDDTPEEVNEQEIITTLTVVLTPEGANVPLLLQSRDLDGDGPDEPVLSLDTLPANTVFDGTIVLLNELETPPENITFEVIEEADEHQMFYIPGSGVNIEVTDLDNDPDGNPLGVNFTLTTGAASSGNFNVVLRHEPNKPNDGTLGDAGGETDISVNFQVVIQ